MWKSVRRRLAIPALAAASGILCLGALHSVPAYADESNGAQASAGQPDPQATEAAFWIPREAQFTYMGFTTHYSCDGLRDTIRDMLLQLGARKDDLKVYEQGCAGNPDRPDPFPGVRIKMSVLAPAPSPPLPGTQTVPAHWKTVKLPYRETALYAAGECELLEQFKQKILPLFTVRNVDLHATCVPHQLEPLGTKLQAEVLVTDQKKNSSRQASAADTQ
jgi:hypothetical protein